MIFYFNFRLAHFSSSGTFTIVRIIMWILNEKPTIGEIIFLWCRKLREWQLSARQILWICVWRTCSEILVSGQMSMTAQQFFFYFFSFYFASFARSQFSLFPFLALAYLLLWTKANTRLGNVKRWAEQVTHTLTFRQFNSYYCILKSVHGVS